MRKLTPAWPLFDLRVTDGAVCGSDTFLSSSAYDTDHMS